jgi:hypothetical protein
MNNRIALRTVWLVLFGVVPALLACSVLSQAVQPEETLRAQALSTQVLPDLPSQAVAIPAAGKTAGLVRQWGASAEASSEWGTSDWVAQQAAGEPNTLECGDIGTAWAAAGQDTVEWINVYTSLPMNLSEIRIVQTYNPDQVVKVDLIDMQGEYINVYTGTPKQVDHPCPYVLSIPVSRSDILAQGVRITIDQSILGLGWNEIDAVEFVGLLGEGKPVRPVIPTP